jgi:hypothetical protein
LKSSILTVFTISLLPYYLFVLLEFVLIYFGLESFKDWNIEIDNLDWKINLVNIIFNVLGFVVWAWWTWLISVWFAKILWFDVRKVMIIFGIIYVIWFIFTLR